MDGHCACCAHARATPQHAQCGLLGHCACCNTVHIGAVVGARLLRGNRCESDDGDDGTKGNTNEQLDVDYTKMRLGARTNFV